MTEASSIEGLELLETNAQAISNFYEKRGIATETRVIDTDKTVKIEVNFTNLDRNGSDNAITELDITSSDIQATSDEGHTTYVIGGDALKPCLSTKLAILGEMDMDPGAVLESTEYVPGEVRVRGG